MLPLRLTLAFKNAQESAIIISKSLQVVSKLKLFNLEIECDSKELTFLLDLLQNRDQTGAFKVTLSIQNSKDIYKVISKAMFDEIVLEIPFYFDKEKIEIILSHIKEIKNIEKLSISYFINKKNISYVDYILSFIVSKGIRKFIIPSPNLILYKDLIKEDYLSPFDLNNLKILNKYKDLISFQVHDFFTARFLELPLREEYIGCQAGKYLCYILNGNVYPCKSIPINCGSILVEPFEKIWENVKKVMDNYKNGKECITCNKSHICKYGCPGSVFFVNEGRKDPLCEVDYGNLS